MLLLFDILDLQWPTTTIIGRAKLHCVIVRHQLKSFKMCVLLLPTSLSQQQEDIIAWSGTALENYVDFMNSDSKIQSMINNATFFHDFIHRIYNE